MIVNEKHRITEDCPGYLLKIRTISYMGNDPGVFSAVLNDHDFYIRSRAAAIQIINSIANNTLEDLDSVEIHELKNQEDLDRLSEFYDEDNSFEEKYFGSDPDEE